MVRSCLNNWCVFVFDMRVLDRDFEIQARVLRVGKMNRLYYSYCVVGTVQKHSCIWRAHE